MEGRQQRIVVTGAGGFIGHHLVGYLKRRGCKHVSGPQGVRGRNSDNTRLREVLGWEPEISLEEGIARTYPWIEEQVRAKLNGK